MGSWPDARRPHFQQYPPGPYGAFPGSFPPFHGPGSPHLPPWPEYPPQPQSTFTFPHAPPGWGPPPTMPNSDPWGPQPPPGWAAPPHDIPAYLRAHDADRVGPFTAGADYGPVLRPFHLRVLGAQVKLNPLLQPLPPESNAVDRDPPHLNWSMLFPSSECRRSTDPSHVSWSAGRNEPATHPRVTKLHIVTEAFPWTVLVRATNRTVGVTCGDVIDGLSQNLHKLAPQEDFEALSLEGKERVSEAYEFNRSRVPGAPGGRLGEGMRRVDFLGEDVVFGGICEDDGVVRKIVGEVPPCVFVLKSVRSYPLDAEMRERTSSRWTDEARRAEAIAQPGIELTVPQPKLNPLLELLPESGAAHDRPHLEWSMLFPSIECRRSTDQDPSHVSSSSWSAEPATHPPVAKLNIVSQALPWMVVVRAKHSTGGGVTCGDVIGELDRNFHRRASKAEFEALSPRRQRQAAKAYHFNRSRGSGLGEGMCRVDFLGEDVVFGGIVEDDGVVRKIVGDVLPCTFVLRCVRSENLGTAEMRERGTEKERGMMEDGDDVQAGGVAQPGTIGTE